MAANIAASVVFSVSAGTLHSRSILDERELTRCAHRPMKGGEKSGRKGRTEGECLFASWQRSEQIPELWLEVVFR